jgi:hypothetical protein
MVLRKILQRLRGSTKSSPLEQARAEFEAAARELVEANGKARAEGLRHTPEMGAAAERLTAVQQRLQQAKADHDKATGGPEAVELTELVIRKVKQAFPADDQAEAVRLLEKECGRNLPFNEGDNARGLERVRLAVLKLSGGDSAELRKQIEVAKEDWRDVLNAAEYPEASSKSLAEFSMLDEESRRDLEARDRLQYEEWLRGGSEPQPPAA